MKKLILFMILLLVLPSVLSINLSVEKLDSQEVMVSGLNNPAIFEISVTNNERTDTFIFYNLLGFTIEPKEEISIERDETKIIELTVYPKQNLDVRNFYTFPYFIRASNSDEQSEKLTIKIIDIEDAFEIGTSELDPEASTINVYIYNKENLEFNDLNVKFSSKFFELNENIDLKPYERKDFNIELNKDDFKEIVAGFYTLKAEVSKENVSGKLEGVIKFIEKDIVETEEKDTGFIVSTKTISKKNNGNTLSPEQIIIQKNIISRLFTSFSPEPDSVQRSGWGVTYTWSQELNPGESISVIVKTNWLYPLVIILFLVILVVLIKNMTVNDLILRKKVSFVKAKGGEFALKITLFVTAKRYIERVNIIDRLPPLMKIYQRFGGQDPSRVDEDNRLIEWDFQKLEAGEIRTLSYVIYSKNVGVMGKFALPAAAAIFQREGTIKETTSNKAFFITEQRKTDGSEFDGSAK